MAIPNILFIFSDQQHWEAVGYRDSSFDTPHLDALAGRSTVFNRAFCTTPQCSPSRSSIMTGNYPSKTGVVGNYSQRRGKPLMQPTIGKMLQDAGYHTGYFGKWHLGGEPIATTGWNDEMGVTGNNEGDEEATRRAIAFLENAPADKPFALFLAINNPHDVYQIASMLKAGIMEPEGEAEQTLPRTWYEQNFATVPAVHEQFMAEDQGKVIHQFQQKGPWKLYREHYRNVTKMVDNHVGNILNALEESGHGENTAIIATSDHGDMDCQHRLVFKGPFMYDHMLRVPLTIHLPGQAERRDVDYPTINVDLAPTFAALAGIGIKADGVSLMPVLEGQSPAPRDGIFAEYNDKQLWDNPIRTIITDRYKFSRYVGGPEELYDQLDDPEELNNLATSVEYSAVKESLSSQLDAWIEANGDPFYDLQPTDRHGSVITVVD